MENLRGLVRRLAKSKRAIALFSSGTTGPGRDTVAILYDLFLAAGKIGRPGCGVIPVVGISNLAGANDMGAAPDRLPGWRLLPDPVAEAELRSARGAGTEVSSGRRLGEILRSPGHPLKALIVVDHDEEINLHTEALRRERPETVVIVFTGYANVETARDALKNGAFDYVPKPFTPDEIKDVVRNLVNNAVKYGRAGTPVRVRLERRGGELVLIVRNEGVGISAEDIRNRLFKRFERLKQKGTEGIKGSGLGLYICRTIVEKHGGRIWAESEPGAWAAFFVALPLAPVPEKGTE